MQGTITQNSYKYRPDMKRTRFAALLTVLMALTTTVHAQTTSLPEPYKLLPGDTLNVSVWKEPELQKDVAIRPDGRFSFPLVGDVVAVGRTVTQVQDELVTKLAEFIPDVVLTVSVTQTLGNKVFVIGQVQNPGEYVVNPMVDVVQALSIAGGTTPFAAVNDIIILRREGDNQRVLEFRYGDVEKGESLEQNVVLVPGDVVIVP